MISVDDADRTGIDEAIAASMDRLGRRAGRLGDGAIALADAAAAAGADGKRARPRMVVAAFRALTEPGAAREDAQALPRATDAAVWQVAAAFEILHTAFVVHDDLIDRDLERRGIPNVAGRFRTRALAFGARPEDATLVADAAAVLAGDLLLFEASRLIAAADVDAGVRTALFDILDDAILVSAAGELADVENAARTDVPETDELLGVAHDKTAAYSFEAPLLAGAALAHAPLDVRTHLAAAATDLGLAFQLVDDLIGTFGTRGQAGRDPGADLREAKRTPLIGLARRRQTWPQVRSALALAHTGPVAVRRAQRELEASGARDDVEVLVREALGRARSRAASPELPAPAGALLLRIATVIEERIP
ncbi:MULTISPECIES: polyprenyl synthetase family protein [unclassified Microbacterium]|uniref:polyprenyl synthetase family protein n=1 Tax=unclassified Microbacterium TaxID=2609290 RepID=UPI0030171E75